jgi:hypothetical protein
VTGPAIVIFEGCRYIKCVTLEGEEKWKYVGGGRAELPPGDYYLSGDGLYKLT